MRMLIGFCFALIFIVATAADTSAQTGSVRQLFAFEVPPGQADAFLEIAARITAVYERHEPNTKSAMYATLVSTGPGTMAISRGFPNAEAWGTARAKLAADLDYRTAVRALQSTGARLRATVLHSNVTPSGGSSAMFGAGSVAQIFILNVPPGQQAAALELFSRGRAVIQRHAPESGLTVWTDITSGGPGNTQIVVEYPSAAAWGAAHPKIMMDSEWQGQASEAGELGIEVVSHFLVSNVTPACCQ